MENQGNIEEKIMMQNQINAKNESAGSKPGVLVLISAICLVLGGVMGGIIGYAIGQDTNGTKEEEGLYYEDPEIEEEEYTEEEMIMMEIENDWYGIEDPLEAEKFLDEKIAEYAGTELEYNIISLKVYRYLEEDDGEHALEAIGKVDVEALSDSYKADYYSTMAEIYAVLGDEEKVVYYDDKFDEIWSKIEAEEEIEE